MEVTCTTDGEVCLKSFMVEVSLEDKSPLASMATGGGVVGSGGAEALLLPISVHRNAPDTSRSRSDIHWSALEFGFESLPSPMILNWYSLKVIN